MQDLNDLFFFNAVVEHGGFSAAGRALGMHKSKLSRRIVQLEERLGVRLLNRSSRSFSVTEIGREFYKHCTAMLEEAEAAERIVAEAQAEPRGLVRMSCPTGLLSFQFGKLIARFMTENPAVQVQLDSTNRRVDVVNEGYDLAVRVRFPPLESSDLVMKQLDESFQCLVAAPGLSGDAIRSPADLYKFPSLDMARPSGGHQWQLHSNDNQTEIIQISPRLITDDMSVLREAALAGVGAVQLPTMLVWDDIRSGRLVHILPDWRPTAGIVHAVFPTRRGLLPSVRSLLDFLARECAIERAQANRLVPSLREQGPT